MLNQKKYIKKIIGGAQSYKILCLTSSLVIVSIAAIQPVFAQSNDVLNRINRIENELDTLNRAVYRGEKPPAASSQNPPVFNSYSNNNNSAGNVPNAEIRLQQLEDQLRDMNGKLEEQRYNLEQLKRKVERIEKNAQVSIDTSTDKKITPYTGQNTHQDIKNINPGMSVMAKEKQSGMKVLTPKSHVGETDFGVNQLDSTQSAQGKMGDGKVEPTLLYEQAFADLKAENYSAAQKGFNDFLENYKEHSLASNAKYWLGETYYVQGKFDKAARIFAEGYRSYPKSSKAPDNLLKLGMSLAGMGKKDDACIALAQLPKKHGDASGAILRRGEQERERLSCK